MNLNRFKLSVPPALILPFLALALSSCMSVGLLVTRAMYVGRSWHSWLIWNLILAWIPLGCAVATFVLARWRVNRWLCFGCGIVWLLFFPNAPYLVTDLVHLRPAPPVPYWFDLLILVSFAWNGLLVGFASLYLMQCLVAKACGRWVAWLFVAVAVGLGGLGVYIGRFMRWNSWDVVQQPFALANDLLNRVVHPPSHFTVVGFTGIFTAFLLVAYLTFCAAVHLKVAQWEPQPARTRE